MHARTKNLCPYVLMSTLQKTEEQKNKRRINNDRDAHAQKKLMSFCSYVYTLKDRRTQEQKKNQ